MLRNKWFVILAVVALAGAARADSEEDAEEIANLPEDLKVFSTFCLSSRDKMIAAMEKLQEDAEKPDAVETEDPGEALELVCKTVDKMANEAHEHFDQFKSTLGADKFANTLFTDVPCDSNQRLSKNVAACANVLARLQNIRNFFSTHG